MNMKRRITSAVVALSTVLSVSVLGASPAAAVEQPLECGAWVANGSISLRACGQRWDGGRWPWSKDRIEFSIQIKNHASSPRRVSFAPWVSRNFGDYQPRPHQAYTVPGKKVRRVPYFTDHAIAPVYFGTAVTARYGSTGWSGYSYARARSDGA